ncbi:hypothetical protein EX30DRAFT_373929 [Ascodesmis nigricans]|uniref:Transmembrane protein n=1 Tax=Ascodesmis nigricans TaxID=341454 RepID=A0A4S2MMX9_9PEZI|nr:hypothetical protein EX30DRAFT_373929 [Ascodesmis nigricans]
MFLPRILTTRATILLFLLLAFLALSAAASSSTNDLELEKRQSNYAPPPSPLLPRLPANPSSATTASAAAPSFRFSVHTHAESAIKYSISPIYVSLLIGSAGVVVAGLMS